MNRKLAYLCFVAASACSVAPPVFAPPPQQAPSVTIPQSAKERFIATAAVYGCEVNETNSAAILADATLSVDDLARIMTELRAEGRGQIAPDGTSFRVTSGACA